MTLADIRNLVKYVANAEGVPTEVLVPIALWEKMLESLNLLESGLDPEDENEPKEAILADLQASVRLTKAGETMPISELWQKVYE
jgi:hypothetical protein